MKTGSKLSPSQAAYLRRGLLECFDVGELKTLCADLGVDYQDLAGESRTDKARELIAYLERRGQVGELIEYCSVERPPFAWKEALKTQRGRQALTPVIESGKAQRFWKPFDDGDLQVVLGRFSEFQSFEETGLIAGGDAIGLIELSSFFGVLDLRDFRVAYADRMAGDALRTNLVVIGGPDANSVSKAILPQINSTLRFGNPDQYEIALHDLVEKKRYAPFRLIGSSELSRDYGLIVKTRNPFDNSRWLLFVAGSFGYGTWAGIRFLTSEDFYNIPSVLEHDSFECLIETDLFRETPQVIRLITIRPMN